MRKVIQEFLEPTIERMTKDREMTNLVSKRQENLMKKVQGIESIIMKGGSKNTQFDDIYQLIADHEKQRKMGFEMLRQEMENVKRNNMEQGFLVDQAQKQIYTLVQKIDYSKIEHDQLQSQLDSFRKQIDASINDTKLYIDAKQIQLSKDIKLIQLDHETVRSDMIKHNEFSIVFERQLSQLIHEFDMMKNSLSQIAQEKISNVEFQDQQASIRQQLVSINHVLDEFSNEFLRLENFIEKYVPLRMQNAISETLDNVLQIKDKKKLREYEEKKFLELRQLIIEDKGLPNLIQEVKSILTNSGRYDDNFNSLMAENGDKEVQGLQEERLMKHKHFHILSENMVKLDNEARVQKLKAQQQRFSIEIKKEEEVKIPTPQQSIDANAYLSVGNTLSSRRNVARIALESGSSSYHDSSLPPQNESTFERIVRGPGPTTPSKNSGSLSQFQLQMRSALLKMVKNKEQDQILKQQFKDEMDSNTKTISDKIDALKNQLQAKQEMNERKIHYLVEEAQKVMEQKFKNQMDQLRIESSQMVSYAQNNQDEIDKIRAKSDKVESLISNHLAKMSEAIPQVKQQINFLNKSLVYNHEVELIKDHLRNRDHNSYIRYLDCNAFQFNKQDLEREYEFKQLDSIKEKLQNKISETIKNQPPYNLIREDLEKKYFDVVNIQKRLHLSQVHFSSPQRKPAIPPLLEPENFIVQPSFPQPKHQTLKKQATVTDYLQQSKEFKIYQKQKSIIERTLHGSEWAREERETSDLHKSHLSLNRFHNAEQIKNPYQKNPISQKRAQSQMSISQQSSPRSIAQMKVRGIGSVGPTSLIGAQNIKIQLSQKNRKSQSKFKEISSHNQSQLPDINSSQLL